LICFASAYLSDSQQDLANWRCLVAHEMEPSAKKTTKMKALTYWDPFRELEDMQHRLSTVLGRQLNRRQDGDKESITVAEWAPVVDIIEDETEYLIKVDLPEIKKEEVKVTVENGVLVLSGERKLEKEERAENITVLRGPTAALAAPSACRTMRTQRR
jgi:HSP20 family protein